MDLALTILPIALAIALGWAARASGLVREQHWPGVEELSFKLLIPAILIHSIAGADLSLSRIGAFAVALVMTVAVGGAIALSLRLVLAIPNASLSTLYQTAIRFNGFISLAAAALLMGNTGLSLIAVAMAVLIPVVNVLNIIVLAVLCGGGASPVRIVKTVVTNPLVIGGFIGIAVNQAGGLPHWADETLEIVGRAALAVGLLAVGAGIQLKRLMDFSFLVVLGLILRPLVVPALYVGIAWLLDLSSEETLAGILIFAVPAASNGYIVAKAMGGDAPLYADLLAWQTLLCLIAIPAYSVLVT
ncbi:AEC family transporter [Pseudoruegeria sp. HB172150]|uniref:AEC family transporter n=1 Tax=Pseudoruegeria sp. HB172150 TaxID=2721164 RepID=UPI0015521B65|nr:AEC family transporter [Pseudoruegeria sp. HB172150]